MKILMLTPYLPYPPASGGQIRTLNLLKYLSRNNEITLVSLYKNEKEKQYASQLKLYCKNVFICKRAEKPWQLNIIAKALFTLQPLLVVRNFSREAQILLKKLLSEEHFDVIHAETFYIMPHLPPSKIPILLVEQTIEYQVYQHFVNKLPLFFRPFFILDIIKLKYWEQHYWRKATTVSAVSESDKNLIKSIESDISPIVIPNGAGDEMFVSSLSKKIIDSPTLLFQGNFAWLQNTEAALFFIHKLIPLIRQKLPGVKAIIAGQQTNKIKGTKNSMISYLEIPPDNVEMVKLIYQQSTLFIAPIFGPGGTRLKILAAMASGLPVISTQIGVEGLEVKNKKHVLIANTPSEFVDAISSILANIISYNNIRDEAYKLAKEKYNWSSITHSLEVVYETIINKYENRN